MLAICPSGKGGPTLPFGTGLDDDEDNAEDDEDDVAERRSASQHTRPGFHRQLHG